MEQLKKCPFCGGKEIDMQRGITGLTMILCFRCGATVSFQGNEDKEGTVKCWNKRM